MKEIVIYGSKYGTTKQYSEWIAKELNADLVDVKKLKTYQIKSYDRVIFGGGLYAGGILGVKHIIKCEPKDLIIFTVGLANPKETDYKKILDKNFTQEQQDKIKVFHLHGGIDYNKLSLLNKIMMFTVKKSIQRQPPEKLSNEDTEFLATYGKKVNFVNKKNIQPVVDYCFLNRK